MSRRSPEGTLGEQRTRHLMEPNTMQTIGFLSEPRATAEAQSMFDEDIAELGYVMNTTRLWAYQPAAMAGLFSLIGQINTAERLSLRQRAILVTACASALGDSYCALAWGKKLADASDAPTAAGVVGGVDDHGLSVSDRALARWARTVVRRPSGTTEADVQQLRDVGFNDAQIFTITAFVALRLAFSTINDSLGLRPDAGLRVSVPTAVREAISYGRPIDEAAAA
jgi:uncharacterized peroxidase-related enzyme